MFPRRCSSQVCLYYSDARYNEERYNGGVAPLSTQAFHILVSLAERDHHGYGIMQDVAEGSIAKLRSPGLVA